MIFTLEALYTLHIFNNYSDDLVFLPLPVGSSKNRKENLLSVIEKGFEDLKEMGLIVDNQPTEECAQYGAYLKEYHDANYHCQVDQRLSYAPELMHISEWLLLLWKLVIINFNWIVLEARFS